MDKDRGDDGVYGHEEKIRDDHLASDEHARVVLETKRMIVEKEKKDTESKLVGALAAMTKTLIESASRAHMRSQQVAGISALSVSEIRNLDKIISHDAYKARHVIVQECHRVVDVIANKIQMQVDKAVILGKREYLCDQMSSKQDLKLLEKYDTWGLYAKLDYEALLRGVEADKDKALTNFNKCFRVYSNEIIRKIEALTM